MSVASPVRRAGPVRAERPALLALSHGTSSPTGQAAISALLQAVRAKSGGVPVAGGFVDVQQPDVAKSFALLEPGQDVVVVPLLLSAGYHVHVDIARELAEQGGRDARLAEALGPDDALVQVLASRLAERGLGPGDAVVLAAAGSSDHRAVRDCLEMGRRLAGTLARPVTVGFISAAVPRLASAIETTRRLHPGARVVVSSYLLASGSFADLAAAAGGDLTTEPLLAPGRRPPSQLVDLVLERYHTA
ncbi:MAG TPA: CbiX/SirB N-terminal domain-containing protein [Humibacter sp.]|nr:CbiX/SirB N-terminal domain-containing protein [Humibacter sp.]